MYWNQSMFQSVSLIGSTLSMSRKNFTFPPQRFLSLGCHFLLLIVKYFIWRAIHIFIFHHRKPCLFYKKYFLSNGCSFLQMQARLQAMATFQHKHLVCYPPVQLFFYQMPSNTACLGY